MGSRRINCACRREAFSLVEMLMTVAILGILMSFVLSLLVQSRLLIGATNRQADRLLQGMQILDQLSLRLSTATLNSRPAYFNPEAEIFLRSVVDTSANVVLAEEATISFVTGPSAQILGGQVASNPGDCICWATPQTQPGITGAGEFAQSLVGQVCMIYFGPDPESTGVSRPRYRYRLVLVTEPAESMRTLMRSTNFQWYREQFTDGPNGVVPANAQVLAENVVALLVAPLDASGRRLAGMTVYDSWDWLLPAEFESPGAQTSFNRLPAALEIGVVSIPGNTADRLAEQFGAVPPLGEALEGLSAQTDWEQALLEVQNGFNPPVDFQFYQGIVRLDRNNLTVAAP
ncbi:MAG: prepilin-type N-terminal cleavage/methylation domain-containing protein [Verrucomicrobiota bacterium]